MKWDEYFKQMVYDVASKSQDRSSKYGAVITDRKHRVLGTGYNGLPRGVEYQDAYHDRPDKYMLFVHAEQNAILGCAAVGTATDGGIIYVIKPPCADCVKAIIQAGIEEIIWYEQHDETDINKVEDVHNWRLTLKNAMELIQQSGTRLRKARL